MSSSSFVAQENLMQRNFVIGDDTTGADELHISFDSSDPKLIRASSPSPDTENKISAFSRLLLFASGYEAMLALSVVLAVVGVLIGILPYYLLGKLLASLVGETLTMKYAGALFLLAAGAELVSRSALVASTVMSHRVAYRTLYRVRVALTQKLGRIPLGRITDTPSGKLKKVFVEDIQTCERPLAHLLPELIAHITGPIVVIIYLFVLDWRLALGALVPIVLGMLSTTGMLYKYEERFQRYNQTNQQMNATIVEYVQGIAVIKAFNQSAHSFGKYQRDVKNFREATVSWFRSTQIWTVLAWVLVPAALVFMVPLGAYLVATGQTSLAVLLICCALALSIGPSLLVVADHLDFLSLVTSALDDVMRWFEEPELVHGKERVELDGLGFTLEDAVFSYHDSDKVVALSGIDMHCPEGSFTAIVGPSGAGKSTIGRLLAGYWQADSGRVELGNQKLTNIPQAQLMEKLSYVTQDNYLFDTTIAENLRLAMPDASEDQMLEALRTVGCDGLLHRLPQGIHTRVGGAGTHLSGGERQRITIARALLKDAPIVILDEATSYLDPVNEAKVQEAITKLTSGKTLIVIAHRLSTVTEADCLQVVRNGEIVERGTHQELLQQSGLYAQLWQTHQAARAAAGRLPADPQFPDSMSTADDGDGSKKRGETC